MTIRLNDAIGYFRFIGSCRSPGIRYPFRNLRHARTELIPCLLSAFAEKGCVRVQFVLNDGTKWEAPVNTVIQLIELTKKHLSVDDRDFVSVIRDRDMLGLLANRITKTEDMYYE